MRPPPIESRQKCVKCLEDAAGRVQDLHAFIGLDGFVDEIIHAVDQREDAGRFTRIPSLSALGHRVLDAAGKSTNIELVTRRTKLGGNGPIMANALVRLGLKVCYVGALGYPNLHPVFAPLAGQATVYSIADPAHTDALEFDDGKLLLGKLTPLNDVTWPTIQDRMGRKSFLERLGHAHLAAFVNWTMIPHMSAIWEALLEEVFPGQLPRRVPCFFDLCDPEKHSPEEIRHALKLIGRFQKYFDVILGLNEKEAIEIGRVLGIAGACEARIDAERLAGEIYPRLSIHTLVVHPVPYAVMVDGQGAARVEGPVTSHPMITTGAGDHFNAGFCFGRLLGMDRETALLTGVTTSGFYVRTGTSPTLAELQALLMHWPGSDGDGGP